MSRFRSGTVSIDHMQIINQIYKNKARTILWKIQKNNYDPKIETVKYLELIDLNKIWSNI